MRTACTLLSFLFVPGASLLGQTWAPVGAEWVYNSEFISPPWPPPPGFTYSVHVPGDTVVAGQLCSIVHFPYADCNFPAFGTSDRYMYMENDSVYWYNAYDGDFDLVWTYAAQPGDAWRIPVNFSDGGTAFFDTITYSVVASDTIWYDGDPLRRVTCALSSNWVLYEVYGPTTIIERMGGQDAMFPWYLAGCSDGIYVGPLLCYSEPGFSWPAPGGVDCAVWLGETPPPSVGCGSVTPNPVERGAMVRLNLTTPVRGGTCVEIFDLTCRNIREIPIRSSITEFVMPQAGVFLITVRNSDRAEAFTRVVVH